MGGIEGLRDCNSDLGLPTKLGWGRLQRSKVGKKVVSIIQRYHMDPIRAVMPVVDGVVE